MIQLKLGNNSIYWRQKYSNLQKKYYELQKKYFNLQDKSDKENKQIRYELQLMINKNIVLNKKLKKIN
tara:strand:- start:304 stop:507 length:204 start_codon:yes stop_codon:yes gene_type:complete